MATTIKLKHTSQAGKPPVPGNLAPGELALNLADEKIYMKNSSNAVVQIAGPGNDYGEYVKLDGDATAQTIKGSGGLKINGLIDGNANAELNGVLNTKGIGFNKGGGSLNNVGYRGFYYGQSTKCPVLIGSADTNGDDSVTAFRVQAAAYHFSTTTALNVKNAIALNIAPPLTTFAASQTPGSCENVYGLYLSEINQNVLANNGTIYNIRIGQNSPSAQANGKSAFAIYSEGTAPSFSGGDIFIGGTAARNTLELWLSTLTEEQREQYSAGTYPAPFNVRTPGDGSFVRQWWYDQQSAEDQALIDTGEIEYPEQYKAQNFTDTFALQDTAPIQLYTSGRGKFNTCAIGLPAPEAKSKLHVRNNSRNLMRAVNTSSGSIGVLDFVAGQKGGGSAPFVEFNFFNHFGIAGTQDDIDKNAVKSCAIKALSATQDTTGDHGAAGSLGFYTAPRGRTAPDPDGNTQPLPELRRVLIRYDCKTVFFKPDENVGLTIDHSAEAAGMPIKAKSEQLILGSEEVLGSSTNDEVISVSFHSQVGSDQATPLNYGSKRLAPGEFAKFIGDEGGRLYFKYGNDDAQNRFYGVAANGTETEAWAVKRNGVMTISSKLGIGTDDPTEKLEVDGNVKANNVTIPTALEDPNNYTTTTEEYEEIIQVPVEDGVATADLVNGAPEQQFEEQTVTRTREVTTYTGPTLDVKETLLALTGALENLKAAAASATTCDELRTAIETALADI